MIGRLSRHPTTGEIRAEVARILLAGDPVPGEKSPGNGNGNGHPKGRVDWQDPSLTEGDQLRGVPCVGRGVAGVIRGTAPGSSAARLEADERWLAKQGHPRRRRRWYYDAP